MNDQMDEDPFPHYGFPVTRDPRCYVPDEQCCSPAEIAAWEADKAAVERGDTVTHPREGTGWFHSGDGKAVVHIDTSRWGIGITTCLEYAEEAES